MSARDDFRNVVEGAGHIFDITPDDSNDLPFVTRAIWVSSSSGDVQVILRDTLGNDGSAIVIPNVPGYGYLLRVRAVRVLSSSTTAGGLQGWV